MQTENELIWMVFAEHLLVLFSIPLLLWIGYRLFVLGVTGQMTITGTLKSNWSVKLTQVAPGTLCFLLGISLGAYSLHSTFVHSPSGETTMSYSFPNSPHEGPTFALNSEPSMKPTAPKTTSAAPIIAMLNGDGAQPLSFRIRYALSELAICKAETADPSQCEQKYYGIFMHIPKERELTKIEKEEKDIAGGNQTAKKALSDDASAIEVHQ